MSLAYVSFSMFNICIKKPTYLFLSLELEKNEIGYLDPFSVFILSKTIEIELKYTCT